MGILIEQQDGADGKEFRLDRDRMVIGRRPSSDIVLTDPAVSGRHALIINILDDSFIENLSQTNGTFVNDRRIEKGVLQEGDVITIGKNRFIYHSEKGAPGVDEEDFEKTMVLRPGQVARSVADEQQARAMKEAEDTAAMEAIEPEPSSAVAVLKVRSGPAAGKQVKIDRSMVTLGRPGVQVVVVSRRKDGYYISYIAGASGSIPSLNGKPLKSRSTALSDGDVIELAGVEIEFSL